MAEELNLDEWLISTHEKRAELLSYASSKIPTDPGERQLDVSNALEHGQDAGDLLADMEVYLTHAYAVEVLKARKKYDAQTSRAVALSAVADIQRLRDGLSVLYRTIKDRKFALMNLNRCGQ